MLKRLTTSIYTFEKLIDGGYLYVDKTEHIWRLVEPPSGIYFLSRPRRFGKSLTLSTLKAVFEGKRHLFRGLAIDSLPYEWKTHPVIHLDMGESSVSSAKELSEVLSRMLENVASEHGLELAPAMVSLRFSELIRTLSKKNGVVILVDEYDKPILDNIGKSHVEEIRDALSNFYSVIKSTESCQRFVFMTGVSKFSKVSVFSKLNNLTDLTMDAKCATMLGYTQTELEENFSGYLDQVCSAQNVVRPDLLDNLRKWYNGYRFEESAPTVYNPVSVGKFFESGGKFRNYWFETGTPTFLLKLAKKQQFDFEQELSRSVDELAFSSYEIDKLDVLPLLVQTGYLTIHSSETKRMTRYFLGFPNHEVELAFESYLLDEYSGVAKERVSVFSADIADFLEEGRIDDAMETMKCFFANIPYDIQIANEKYYQTIFYVVFRILGLFIEAESRTSAGRIDAVAVTDRFIHLFEFKIDGSADDALAQIRDRDYFRKYASDPRVKVLVGVNFSTATRNIGEWKTTPA